MKWRGGARDGDVEDRRGLGPAVGGVGVGGVIIALIAYFVFGVDPNDLLNSGVIGGEDGSQGQAKHGSPTDEQGQFADTVFTSANRGWSAYFEKQGQTYEKPTIVLYDGRARTGCGQGVSAMGPFYCPNDRKVYIDLSFFQELSSRFGAPGEFARAYVIAHEVGHHVQTLTGVSQKARAAMEQASSQAEANAYSIALELQADCYAGVWAANYAQTGRLEDGDIGSAMAAAAAVGDDTLQKRTQGQAVPDSFTHGTSEQRTRWFMTGYRSGDPAACDTFRGV